MVADEAHNKKFTLTEMERLTHIAFDEVTPDHLKSLIAQVQQKVEDHYWEADELQMELVDEFVKRGTLTLILNTVIHLTVLTQIRAPLQSWEVLCEL